MRKRRRKTAFARASVVCFALLTAAGCATFRFTPTSFTTDAVLARGLSELYGEHIDRLVAVMGYPSSETSVAGRRLHIWKRVEHVADSVPETRCTEYSAYTSVKGGVKRSVPKRTECLTIRHERMRAYHCAVTVEVDDEYRVVGHQIEGDGKGCEAYAGHFRRPSYWLCVREIEILAFFGRVEEEEFRAKRGRCESLR